jgi:hypothetical protein
METTKVLAVTTEAGEMGKIGLKKWGMNALKFTAPLGVMYLSFVIANINIDGFQLTDFVPSAVMSGGIILYILNAATDFLRKLTQAQTYIVEK